MRTRTSPSPRHSVAALSTVVLAIGGVALIQVPVQASPTSDGLADITITQVNAPADGLYTIGDIMHFDVVVKNTGTEARSFVPVSTNLSGGIDKCRWRNIPAGVAKTDCTGLATHTVTADDIAAGGFTPKIVYEIKEVGYAGPVLNTPEEISGEKAPITRAAIKVESISLDDPKSSYTVGDVATYTVRVRSVFDKVINVAAIDSSFDDLAAQCNWKNLVPGAGAVYNCKPLSHTITQADADAGKWNPSITLKATDDTGAELQTLAVSGEPLEVAVDHPNALPAPAPDVDVSLPASLSDAQRLVSNTATDKYRIPAIATAPNGDLLVAYDERPTDNGNNGGDSPNPNHIVQLRSVDGGKTWSEPRYIHKGVETGAKVGYSDPSYVVDNETGTIFNFHVKSYDEGWPGSHTGSDHDDRSVVQAEVSTSRDNGWTWTHRTITADITADPSWKARFAASGQGIQIRHGPHAGRLVQQYTIKTTSEQIRAVSVYSDDHGETWRVGEPVGTGMDENKVVELSDGTLMLNSRVSDGSGFRKVAISSDGGQTWSGLHSDTSLPDSVDNAQIIRAFPNAEPSDPRARILLLSHSPNPVAWSRDRGTISMSCDDGASWVSSRVFNESFVGYTTIAVQKNGTIGLLSEDENYGGIWYRNFTMNWVGDQCLKVHASVSLSSTTVHPGADTIVTVAVTNPTSDPLTEVDVASAAADGLTITPKGSPVDTIAPGASAEYAFTVHSRGEPGKVDLVFPVTWNGGSVEAQTSVYSAPGPEVHPEVSDADSEELVGEAKPSGPASAAVDGDPSTFWHTQWKGASPGFDPETGHWIDLKVKESDVPADQKPRLATLNYLARQGLNMGRAKEFRIYTSDDGSTWSTEPAVTGTLQDSADWQRIPLNVQSRYVRFMAMNSYSSGNNARFLVAAEISLTLDMRDVNPSGTVSSESENPPASSKVNGTVTKGASTDNVAETTGRVKVTNALAKTGVSLPLIFTTAVVMLFGVGFVLRRWRSL